MTEKKQNPESTQPTSLIAVSQTFLCFDLESKEDATQQVEIRRIADGDLAWRVRTNAPTRYIVNPNSGTLSASFPMVKVTVQLVGNNYHPSHELIVQALQIYSDNSSDVWSSERAKILGHVQTIKLELTTTIVNFVVSARNTEASKLSLERLLLRDGLSREDKVRELKDMLQMIHVDTADLEENIEKATRLKNMLEGMHNQKKDERQKLQQQFQQTTRQLEEERKKAEKADDGRMCTIS